MFRAIAALLAASLTLALTPNLAWAGEPGTTDAAPSPPSVPPEESKAPPAPAPRDERNKEQARIHFNRGIAAFREKRFKEAVDSFLEANRIYPSAALSFNAARAYEEMSDAGGALRFYRDYLRRAPDAKDRASVEKRVGELEQKLRKRGIQLVTVSSEPEGATVVLDDRPVGVTPWAGEIFPGIHRVTLRLQGYEEASANIELLPHRALDVELKLKAAAADEPAEPLPTTNNAAPEPAAATSSVPPPEPDRRTEPGGVGTVTWLALGAGAASLGGALFFELRSAGAEDDARGARTQVEAAEHIDSMESAQTTARILAGVGAALVVTGGALLYFDLASPGTETGARSHLQAGCTARACGVDWKGRF